MKPYNTQPTASNTKRLYDYIPHDMRKCLQLINKKDPTAGIEMFKNLVTREYSENYNTAYTMFVHIKKTYSNLDSWYIGDKDSEKLLEKLFIKDFIYDYARNAKRGDKR